MGHALEELFGKLVLACLLVAVAAAALWSLAPLLLVAVPVALAGLRVGARLGLAGLVLSLALAVVASYPDPLIRLLAYAEVQQKFGTAVLDALLAGQRAPALPAVLDYARAAAPFALGYGPLVGGVVGIFFSLHGKNGVKGNETRPLHLVSADELRAMGKGEHEPHTIDGFAARGRLTALTALPKQGKTMAWFGLLRARQGGGTWFGRRVQAGKTLVLTEEDRGTFAGKVLKFGITGETLVSIHAPETGDGHFGREAWPKFVEDAARRARKKGCDVLTVDTLTTWAPWAFAGPEAMSYALRTLKRAVGRYRLAGVVILHNRKAGSDLGAVVNMLGTIAGSAAYDVVAGFEREKASGECTLTVDGRLGEWECTATLVDGRYVPVVPTAAYYAAESTSALPPPVPRMAGVVDVVRRSGAAGLTRDAIQEQTKLAPATLHRYITALMEGGQLVRQGQGVSGDPHVYRVPDSPLPPPTADPEYARYLQSPEWKRFCAAILERAEMHCEAEDCGEPPEDGDTLEVHHLTYERWGHELPEDCLALCSGCHRRAHRPHAR